MFSIKEAANVYVGTEYGMREDPHITEKRTAYEAGALFALREIQDVLAEYHTNVRMVFGHAVIPDTLTKRITEKMCELRK